MLIGLDKLIKSIALRVKYWLGLFFANFVCLFFKIKWQRYKNITIVPHGGLGDIAALVPALKRLSAHYSKINVVCNSEYFEAVHKLFELPANICCVNFVGQHRKEYKIEREFELELKKTGRVIKLGMYANDPIINYPNSFFIKLGVNPQCAHEKYDINFVDFMNQDLEFFFQKFDKQYVYVNLTTSEKLMEFNKTYKSNVPYVSYDDSAL